MSDTGARRNFWGFQMKMKFVAAAAAFALLGAASAASATTFTGSYSTTYQQSDPGLVLQADTPNGSLNFNLSSLGQTTSVNLFHLFTNEASVNGDDLFQKPITVSFTLGDPSAGVGSVSGSTGGAFGLTLKGFFQDGYVVWNNNGNSTIDFADGAQLQVHLDDAIFNKGSSSWFNSQLNPGSGGQATITADFKLTQLAAAVPEPMSWALMLLGFGGLGAALRANRRQIATLTAA